MAEYITNVLAQTSKLDWAFPFERKGGFPLDKSALFSSLEDAQKYATGSATDERKLGGTSYVGQIISVYEPANAEAGTSASVNAYIITPTRGLVKLAATTASGDVAGDIADLQGKVNSILDDIDALEKALEGVYTKSEVDGLIANAKDDRVDGLVESVSTLEEDLGKEVERAAAAEKALGERIDAIDFIDATELATELAPYAKTDDINTTLADYATTSEVETALADYTTTEGLNTLLNGKVSTDTYASDKKALEDEDAAIRAIAEDAQSKIDTFLEGTDTDDVVNKLKEIQTELEALGDAVELEEQFAAKADLTYVNEELTKKADKTTVEGIEGRVKAIEDAPYVTKSQLDGVDGKFADYTKTADLETLLAGKQDNLTAGTDYATPDQVATAKQEAIDDAAGKYATTGALTGVSDRVATLEGIDHSVYATKTELKDTDDVAKDAQNRVGIVEGKIDEITSVGGEPNVIEKVKVNGVTLEVEKDAEGKSTKSVNITVPTKTSDLADDTFGTLIQAAQTQANKGVADAKTALEAAQAAQGTADTNAGNITTLTGRVEAAEGKINENIAAISAHATEYATLKGRVDGHDTAIADRALKSEVYTKDQVNAITGTPTEGKTLVGMINDKANSSDVYGKSEVYTKDETKAEIKKMARDMVYNNGNQ